MNSNSRVYVAIILIAFTFIFSYMALTDVDEVKKKDHTTLSQNNFTQEVSKANPPTTIQNTHDRDGQYLLTIILSLITLVSLSTSFWLYKWRRVVTAGKDIVVPEVFASQVNGIVQAVSSSSSELGTVVNQQSGIVNQFSDSLKNLDESIKGMIDTYMSLQTALNQKDEEIARFKDGYDSKIFHNFLLRFTRVDQVIQEYLKDEKIDLDGLKDIHEVMEDALEECGVELFSPNIGESYLDLDGIAGNPKKIDTKDENQNLTICEVIKAGYRRKLPNSKFEVITQAKVSIFVYKAESQQSEELQTDGKLKE